MEGSPCWWMVLAMELRLLTRWCSYIKKCIITSTDMLYNFCAHFQAWHTGFRQAALWKRPCSILHIHSKCHSLGWWLVKHYFSSNVPTCLLWKGAWICALSYLLYPSSYFGNKIHCTCMWVAIFFLKCPVYLFVVHVLQLCGFTANLVTIRLLDI